MKYHTIDISTKESGLESLKGHLEEKYDCSVREGVVGGCYGARDGNYSKGLTVWMHPKELVDRYVETRDGEKCEFVNPWFLFEENGTLIEDMDGEKLEEIAELLDLEVKSDNTYNFGTDFGSLKSEYAAFMFDFQFSSIELPKGGGVVSVMFHCGGDPRGNYTDKVVYKFKHIDDFYNLIFPSLILLDQNEESEA